MSTRSNLTGLTPPHDVAARDRKITLPLGIRRIGLGEPFGDSKTGTTRLRTCPRISRTAGNALAALSVPFPKYLDSAVTLQSITPLVVAAAHRISRAVGSTPE